MEQHARLVYSFFRMVPSNEAPPDSDDVAIGNDGCVKQRRWGITMTYCTISQTITISYFSPRPIPLHQVLVHQPIEARRKIIQRHTANYSVKLNHSTISHPQRMILQEITHHMLLSTVHSSSLLLPILYTLLPQPFQTRSTYSLLHRLTHILTHPRHF